MNINRTLFFFILALLLSKVPNAQEVNIAKLEINGEDTVPTFNMKEVVIFTKRDFKDNKDRYDFERLKRNTLKVYPYVEMALELYNEMTANVDELDKRRKKKRYIKGREKEIREEFEQEIRHMTKSQGEILIKLINKETGNSCYDIVKQLKNPVTAFFWNLAGKMFGHNLKEEYIPEENPDLEFIVRMIKNQ